MKKKIIYMALIATLITAFQTQTSASCKWSGQRIALIGAGAITGTLIGGPLLGVIGIAMADYFNAKEKHNINTASGDVTTNCNLKSENYTVSTNEHTIFFATASSNLAGKDKAKLDKIAVFLKSDNSINLKIIASADPRGKTGYDNKKLSVKRAQAVKDYLIEYCDIDSSKIYAEGIGAVNDSDKSFRMLRVASVILTGK